MIISDWSEWQEAQTIESLKLLVKNGVKGLILRAGCAHAIDAQVDKYISWCKEIGIPYNLYYYFYPGLGIKHQLEIYMSVIDQYPEVNTVWIDVEEYRNPSTGTVYSPDMLNAFYKSIFMELKKAYPKKIIGIYSGGWVLNAYIPKMYEWAKKYPYWNASYVKYSSWWWNYMASLGATWNSRAKTVTIEKLREIMKTIWLHPVPNAKGFPIFPRIWQCITYIPFTELTEWQCHTDLNLINKRNYNRFFYRISTPKPPPLPEPVHNIYMVNTYALWVRDVPNGTVIDYKWYAQQVEIVDQHGGWGKLSSGGWVNMDYLDIVL